MKEDKIRELFFLISGEAAEDMESQRLMLCNRLCETAQKTVEEMTQKNISEEKLNHFTPLLENLAAARAWHDLMLLDEATMPETMTGEKFAVTFKAQARKAQAFWEQCKTAAAPVLKDNDFYFGRTIHA